MADKKTKVDLDTSKNDHFILAINGIELGEYERSELRHIMQQIDNKI
jgi:hypothetical protein